MKHTSSSLFMQPGGGGEMETDMKNLQVYNVHLKTLTPVYIGGGKRLEKNEYIYNSETGEIVIFDINKMLRFFIKKRLIKEYENYIMSKGKKLADLFRENNISDKNYNEWILYKLNISDIPDREELIKRGIELFVKDMYRKPYIPGSSLKGAIRTILADMELLKNEKLSAEFKNGVDELLTGHSGTKGISGNKIQKKIDVQIFHRKNNVDSSTKIDDKIYDMMSGLLIADSIPLDIKNLTVCQKIDIGTDGKQNAMPMLRECIKPGAEIVFPVKINKDKFSYTVEDIKKAISEDYRNYKKEFLSKFKENVQLDTTLDNVIFIGGGVGYASKTYTYAALHGKDGIKRASNILAKVFKNRGHAGDYKKGASPRMLKCTEYCGKMMQLGACLISFEPK
ncbi:type III-A CRISPR-associated RAMP protein Csm5 [Johnsonella ignava]|uniref:type III-A CRISPR-associated RAMP protein Csm5 n=1 Tax=Johnsonella ignava TaxID=43995 RepID=UPI0023F2F8D0|nr:type III-A CRISPR-associated RAMP protein Csm5 [Johnsonella ignava]